MPMKLNVGASRKVTDNNYGSRGASINVEMELDAALVGEPAKLQEKIRQLFGVVRVSLVEELNGQGVPSISLPTTAPAPSTNGHGAAPRGGPLRPATEGQIKALQAMARYRQLNLDHLLFKLFQLHRPEDLTVRQASQAIDELKSTGAAMS
jgi:hypothetical protein